MRRSKLIKEYEHPFSWKAIGRIVVAGIGVYLFWKIHPIFLTMLLSLMLSAAFYPIVRFLNKKIPLTVSAVIVIIGILIPFILFITIVVSTFVNQFPSLTNTIDSIVRRSTIIPAELRTIDITQYAENVGGYLLRSTSVVANFLTTFLTIIFLCLYIMIDSKNLHSLVLKGISKEKRSTFEKLIKNLAVINGNYIRGNLIISIICGIAITAGLSILGVKYAILLGILAAMLDLLPLVGAFIAMVPAVIIAFSISPLTGVLTLALFLIYQQFENNVLAPHIYNRVLSLSPTLSFVSVLIGASLFGAIGAFIALPIAASLPIVITFITKKKNIDIS